MYLNLGFVIEKIDYTDYILKFDRLFDIPKKHKNAAYKRYIEALVGYLSDYYSRANPLVNLAEHLQRAETEFATTWSEGTFPGWPKDDEPSTDQEDDTKPINLEDFATAKDLETVGLVRVLSPSTMMLSMPS